MSRRLLPVLIAAFVGCTPAPSTTPPKIAEQAQSAVAPFVAPPPPAPSPVDPVASFKEVAAAFERHGVPAHVTRLDFGGPFDKNRVRWCKEAYKPVDLKIDVRKTDSLVSPFEGTLTWSALSWSSGWVSTRQEAQAFQFTGEPTRTPETIWAKFAFQDSRWVVKDVGIIGIPSRSESGGYDAEWQALAGR